MRNIIIALFCIVTWSSCMYTTGSGNIITQTKSTGPFHAVSVGGGFDVEIKRGPVENVQVEADDNLMKYIQVRVSGDELKINLDQMNVRDAHLKVFITAPGLRAVLASAGAEITVKDELKSDEVITMKASSGSNIKSSINAPEVRAEVSSGGELNLSGRTRNLHAESSSGSSISASELLSENSFVKASSGGSARVYASVSIEASASSGGNITYKGAAPTVKKSESSGGQVAADN